ncbi:MULTISPECIES: hypothetical protein [Brevibacillus]|uniref:hypothetical protein n=1 Tax=Brevibacillus TaxID=55080 RepID=UPI000F0A3C2B|nr:MULTISPECIES: hypothetical protein [Brevibacillus]MDR7317974.1 hypothetical protein [Brevibacillus nitrificans]MEC2130565.1 hypothetical protein [Brevibacillus centrosporus]RNB68833.1 hypothetical protein EDM55_15580 [Brevibacillus centrosporus]GED33871.1 hypothetical protein BCE02nite_50120 [Brevibacillus centrosporus]
MDNKQEFALLIDEIATKTEQFLSMNVSCVDEQGVLHPLLEDILTKRDEAVALIAQFPDLKAVLRDAANFHEANEALGKLMSDEFLFIKNEIKKINQAKHFNRSYGNQNQQHNPIFINDLG